MVAAMDDTLQPLLPIQERVRKTTERLEADFSKIATKIHRFPRGLRGGIGGQDERYIIPSFVALGPYHRGLPHLQEAEEVKDAAAHYFCAKSGHSVEEVYLKILSIAGEARGCYADHDAVARFSDSEFAVMMFLDGCFLLQYIGENTGSALLENRMKLSTGPCILRDIFLLENQLPWLVLKALMTFRDVDVYQSIEWWVSWSDPRLRSTVRISRNGFEKYSPPHLLGLLRYYQIGNMPNDDPNYEVRYWALASSAIELAEIGVKLTASNKTWFADMSIQKGPLTGELSLTPLFLYDVSACWLVNMAAFEACTATSNPTDGCTISSYLSLLAMLIDKEEDVHKLRAKHILRSSFSNQEILHFFKGFARHMKLGYRYQVTLDRIERYKNERPVRIAVHKFYYKNFKSIKTVTTLFSIAGVLAGIFRTLLSLKQR